MLEQFKLKTKELKELKAMAREMPNESGDMQCTPQQRSYIYGLCKKHGLNPRMLPENISPKFETRELTLAEASDVIERLRNL